MAAYKDHQQPPLPLEGESQTAEGGAQPQVNRSPNTCTTSSQTNPRLACTPAEIPNPTTKPLTIIAKTLEEEQKKAPNKASIVGTRNPGEN